MSTTIKKIATLLASFILILFVVFVNQTVQIVEPARAVNRGFGNGVLWGLVLTYGVVLGAPFVLWFRLPKRMPPPVAAEGAEYDQFMADFKRQLARNPRLRGIPLNSRIDIDAALQTLDKQADNTVASAASTVFLSTAVLQSGRRDVLVVLVAQTRLVWQMAHIYCQRPSLRDFVQLYANVASTALVAAGMEDVDLDVLIGTVFGSTIAAIAGMHLLTSSILTGAANAFLTLRVGMIAKEYCHCTMPLEKACLRRAATLRAARLLGSIVRDGSAKLSKAAVTASKQKLREKLNWFTRAEGATGIR